MGARIGVEVNFACPARRAAGEKQVETIIPEERMTFIETCTSCGSDTNETQLVLELDTDQQYLARTSEDKFRRALLMGRCGKTGNPFKMFVDPQTDIHVIGSQHAPSSQDTPQNPSASK